MKYIVIGLGNFGSMLAVRLSDVGHEVIGVDIRKQHVEEIKDKISEAICLDSTELHALKILPLREVDAVIVAIGENFGTSVETTALLKQLNSNKIIVRAINSVHAAVIGALGIDQIIYPERDAAEIFVHKTELPELRSSYRIDNNNFIFQVSATPSLIGKTIGQINFPTQYNLRLITVKKEQKGAGLLGLAQKSYQVVANLDDSMVVTQDDILVLYGNERDLKGLAE